MKLHRSAEVAKEYTPRLSKGMYRLTDAEHFSEGNRQLHYAIKNDPALASALEARYPGISEYVAPTRLGTFRGRAFSGTTWHHHGQVGGLLQLVDRSINWAVLGKIKMMEVGCWLVFEEVDYYRDNDEIGHREARERVRRPATGSDEGTLPQVQWVHASSRLVSNEG
ncbi:HNH endonuclease [Burkholderia sp. AU18528]|uniref:HNH endonuclease n=1 Tax=Burkholderia sp. AU18528 TaxID=2015350 RepID=UPI00211DEBC4|nr:HNH endonuclease [Burkholderia sp. AU18528]